MISKNSTNVISDGVSFVLKNQYLDTKHLFSLTFKHKMRLSVNLLIVRLFTLVELLLVVAVVIILIGLLLPLLSKSKERAKQINCASNLKQFNLLCLDYMQDYNDYFPKCYDGYDVNEVGRWYRKLIYYLGDDPTLDSSRLMHKKAFYCPSNPNSGFNASKLAYGFNYFLGNYWANEAGWHRVMEMKNPSLTILIADGDNGYVIGPVGYSDNGDGPTSRSVSIRHSTGCNILWVDGHVNWRKKIEIYSDITLFDRN